MPTTLNPSYRKITTPEASEALSLMKEHIEKQADGLVSYKQGWSDKVIAKIVNDIRGTDHITPGMIAFIRLKEFGKLSITGGRIPKNKTNGAVKDTSQLEARVSDLEMNLAALAQRLNNLIEGLGGLADGPTSSN